MHQIVFIRFSLLASIFHINIKTIWNKCFCTVNVQIVVSIVSPQNYPKGPIFCWYTTIPAFVISLWIVRYLLLSQYIIWNQATGRLLLIWGLGWVSSLRRWMSYLGTPWMTISLVMWHPAPSEWDHPWRPWHGWSNVWYIFKVDKSVQYQWPLATC